MSAQKSLLSAAVAASLATAASASTSLKIGYFHDDDVDTLEVDLAGTNEALSPIDQIAQKKKKKLKKPKAIKGPKKPKGGGDQTIQTPTPNTPTTCCGMIFEDDLFGDFVSVGSGQEEASDLLDPMTLNSLDTLEAHDDPNWVDGIEFAQTYFGGGGDDTVTSSSSAPAKQLEKPGKGITLDNGIKKPGKVRLQGGAQPSGKKRKKKN